MKTKWITVVVGGFLLAGCSRDEVPAEINAAIQEIQDAYMRNEQCNVQSALRKTGALCNRMSLIDDVHVKRACYWRLTKSFLDVDPDKLELRYRGRYLESVLRKGFDSIDTLERTLGAEKEEVWDARLNILSYVRHHVRRLRESIKLPDGVEVRGTMLVVKDVEADRRYMDTVSGYNATALRYENLIRRMEKRDFRDDIKDQPEEVRVRLLRRFEDYLGRPMRTPEQCDQDRKDGTVVEFPFYAGHGAPAADTRRANHRPNVVMERKMAEAMIKPTGYTPACLSEYADVNGGPHGK